MLYPLLYRSQVDIQLKEETRFSHEENAPSSWFFKVRLDVTSKDYQVTSFSSM